jgi:hypothetical protein
VTKNFSLFNCLSIYSMFAFFLKQSFYFYFMFFKTFFLNNFSTRIKTRFYSSFGFSSVSHLFILFLLYYSRKLFFPTITCFEINFSLQFNVGFPENYLYLCKILFSIPRIFSKTLITN